MNSFRVVTKLTITQSTERPNENCQDKGSLVKEDLHGDWERIVQINGHVSSINLFVHKWL